MDVSATGVIAISAVAPGGQRAGTRIYGPDLTPVTPPTPQWEWGTGVYYGLQEWAPDVSIADCGPRLITAWPLWHYNRGPGIYVETTID